jgi:hypothetical protein
MINQILADSDIAETVRLDLPARRCPLRKPTSGVDAWRSRFRVSWREASEGRSAVDHGQADHCDVGSEIMARKLRVELPLRPESTLLCRDRYTCAYRGVQFSGQTVARSHPGENARRAGYGMNWCHIMPRLQNQKKGRTSWRMTSGRWIYLPYVPCRNEHSC